MTAPAPSPLSDRCTAILDEMRAELAAGSRKGPSRMLLAAIVRFLETLLAVIADFRAGRLAALAPEYPAKGVAARAGRAEGTACAAKPVPATGLTEPRSSMADESCNYDSPSRIGGHFCQQESEPVASPSLSVEPDRASAVGTQIGRRGSVSACPAAPAVDCAQTRADVAPDRRPAYRIEIGRRFPTPLLSTARGAWGAGVLCADSKIGVWARLGTCGHFVTISQYNAPVRSARMTKNKYTHLLRLLFMPDIA